MRKIPLTLAALLLAGTAACSSDDDNAGTPTPTPGTTTPAASGTTPPASGGKVYEVKEVSGNAFSPTDLKLKAGDSVHVTDVDPGAPHNFTVDGVGHSDTMSNGDTFTLRFDKAGSYRFVCTFHERQGMEGTITVS